MNDSIRLLKPACLSWGVGLLAILLLGAFAFLPGLSGPLMLDDANNLEPLLDYMAGVRSASNVIFGNISGVLGRPVSMASFVANVALTGSSVSALKAVNLALHLLAGILVVLLLRKLLARDMRLAPHADWLALLLGAIWLLHPVQVSTVLYVVQRMAMLAALFSFAALLAYVLGRERIEQEQRGGLWLLFGLFPLLTLLAVLSKENGVLTPLLAGVLEWTLFVPRQGSRPAAVRAWLTLFVALPVAVGTLLLAFKPNLLDYSGRDFTLPERLLSETRILWDYIGAWLLPMGQRLGIYHDSYPISTSLLSPPTTLLALLGWASAVALAWLLRQRVPAFAAGVAFYLCGHLLESTVLPLELYFEHRNYLPSLGLLMALTGLIAWATSSLHTVTPAFRTAATVLVLTLPIVFAAVTWVQSGIWGSADLFLAQQETYSPESVRVRVELSDRAAETGNLQEALHQIGLMQEHVAPQDALMPELRRILAYCYANQPTPADVFDRIEQSAHGPVSNYVAQVWPAVVKTIEGGKCPSADANRLAEIVKTWLAHAPYNGKNNWIARFYLSLLLASQSRYTEAAEEGEQAWNNSGHSPRFGVFLYQLNGTLENHAAQQKILIELERYTGRGDGYVDEAVMKFRAAQQGD